ncbi:MAG: DUF3617 family protein [Terracidiphilus sp.]
MTLLKGVTAGLLALAAIQICSAQSRFPLRHGEWEAKVSASGNPSPPLTMLLCLNDALWEKALTQDPICTIRQLSVTARGASYTMDCETSAFQMKGNVNMVFDGMEHMTANGKVDVSMSGKTSSSLTEADYRWKSATCSANDANMKQQTKP